MHKRKVLIFRDAIHNPLKVTRNILMSRNKIQPTNLDSHCLRPQYRCLNINILIKIIRSTLDIKCTWVLTLKSGSVRLLNEPTMKRLPVSVSTILANVVYLKSKLNKPG